MSKVKPFLRQALFENESFCFIFNVECVEDGFTLYSNVNISSNKIYIMDKSYSYLKCLKFFLVEKATSQDQLLFSKHTKK